MLFKKLSLSAILALIIVGLGTVTMTSCSKDDEPSGGSNGTGGNSTAITIDGQSLNLSYVYWWADNGDMHIEFYSFDPTGTQYPNSISYLSIDYSIPNDQSEIVSTTLPSGSYSIYVAKNVTMNSDGWQAQTRWNDSSNSPLVIEKSGNNVKITIEKATVSNYTESVPLSINFSGTIKKLPSEYWD